MKLKDNAKISTPTSKRASWFLRLNATVMDLGFFLFAFSLFIRALRHLLPISPKFELFMGILLGFTYFFAQELYFNKTIGKFVLQIKILDRNGRSPSKLRWFLRSCFRFLGPICMLSWKRITFLDWITGTRAYPQNFKNFNSEIHSSSQLFPKKGGWR